MNKYDYKQLDTIFHSRIRLAVASMLYHDGVCDFNSLKKGVGATDGNLTTHLKKMEECAYIIVEKKFVDRKPMSIYQLTDEGKKGLENYIDKLEKFIGDIK